MAVKTASLGSPENQETVQAPAAVWAGGGGGEGITNTQTPAQQNLARSQQTGMAFVTGWVVEV